MNQHKQCRFDFYRHDLDSAHNKVHKKIKFIKFDMAYKLSVKQMYLFHQVLSAHPAATDWCHGKVRDGFRADGWMCLHDPKNNDVKVFPSKILSAG